MAVLKATKREEIGSHRAKRLRAAGMVPCVVYGHGQETQSLSLQEQEVMLAIKHGDRLLELDLEGAMQNVLVKDVQYDTFGLKVLHVDLARVDLDERVTVTVQIVLKGIPVGVSDSGGMLQQVLAETEIECAVRSIPEQIAVKVAEMKLGDHLTLGDLPLPEGATLVGEPGTVVATVRLIAEEVEAAAPAEPGAGEPEVIGAKKEEEGEEAAE